MKKDKSNIEFQGVKYPCSEELYDAYEKGYRKERYFTDDLKNERYIIDNDACSLTIIPSREDSLNRLEDENQEQLAVEKESVEDTAILNVMIEKLHKAIALLPDDEQELIKALYFEGNSERSWSAVTGLPQKTINNRKLRILTKIKKLMKN